MRRLIETLFAGCCVYLVAASCSGSGSIGRLDLVDGGNERHKRDAGDRNKADAVSGNALVDANLATSHVIREASAQPDESPSGTVVRSGSTTVACEVVASSDLEPGTNETFAARVQVEGLTRENIVSVLAFVSAVPDTSVYTLCDRGCEALGGIQSPVNWWVDSEERIFVRCGTRLRYPDRTEDLRTASEVTLYWHFIPS